jgi:hypothetical protein
MALPRSNPPISPRRGCRAGTGILLALTALVLCSVALLSCPASRAQSPSTDVLYSRQSDFHIPFEPEGDASRLRKVILYYSEDQGLTWKKYGEVSPSAKGFTFRAGRDGLYWFAVQTMDLYGYTYPNRVQDLRPEIKVQVDTRNSQAGSGESSRRYSQDAPNASGRTQPEPKYVNSRTINIKYGVEEEGPSGVSAIQLYYMYLSSNGGRKWTEMKPIPYSKDQPPPLIFEANQDGLYGFYLLMKNGVGLGENPPQPNTLPQFLVKVDTVKPEVKDVRTEVGRGLDLGNLIITWQASDLNFGPEPISLWYTEDKDSNKWERIGPDSLPNNGRYIWQKGHTPPHRFFVKVEARDRAGNVGSYITSEVKFDLTHPRGLIRDVEPGAGGSTGGIRGVDQ